MALHALNHYTIRPVDLEATKDFYVGILGLPIGERPPLGFPGYWLYCGDIPTVHLIGPRPDEAGQKPRVANGTGLLDHIAFSCTGLGDTRARLADHRIAFTERVIPRDGQTQLFLHDPDGVAVELNFPAGDS
jgi:catechol 2,3-dioxygenase-like lactoylglutathione lyase family enzyme